MIQVVLPRDSEQGSDSSSQSGAEQRRELLGAKLNNYKQEKLKRKLPVDNQLLNCVKEDIQLKKKLIDQMDRMGKLSSNMDKLTNCISDGFSLLQGLIYPPPGMFQQPYGAYPQQRGMMYNPAHFPDHCHTTSTNDATAENLQPPKRT